MTAWSVSVTVSDAAGTSAAGTASATIGEAPPWQIQPGESVMDNAPAGVALMNYATYYRAGMSLGQVLAAMRSAATGPFLAVLPAGTFHFTDFSVAAGSGTGKCYQDVNSTKLFAGMVGAGNDQTVVVVDPTVMTSTQLSGVTAGSPSPVGMYAIYAGGSALTVPCFFSGIKFVGNLQQSIALAGLSGTAPAPYRGLVLNSAVAGSMVQYCHFQGFGFTAKQSPAYETGSLESNHSSWVMRRCEIDGRLDASINPTQPVVAGGLMWNYETIAAAVDSWMHHSRRSGWAMHDHATTEGGNAADHGVYSCSNFKVWNTSDTTDSYAGSALGFSCSNVEEVRNSFTWAGATFTASKSLGPQHITIATSNGNAMANALRVTDPTITDTAFNGCLVVRYIITPNSGGTSPYYTAYQAGGFSALPMVVTKNGVTLTPVLSTSFNPATNTPANSYVVIFS